jgi:molecular chaperone DnaJ
VAPSTDYYDTLGIGRDASPEEIKKAFRRRARETHPDTSEHDDAEERFKQLNEAYEVLADPAKREMYDRFGTADPREAGMGGGGGDPFGSGGFGMGDLFSVFFDGMGGNFSRQASPEGRDMSGQVVVTLLEAADGAEKEIRYNRLAPCGTCGGSGAEPGGQVMICPQCNGTGQVRSARRTILGTFESVAVCDRCEGTGQVVDPPCPTCGGDGRVRVTESVSVKVPPGVTDGVQLRVRGKGEAGLRGASSGDLIVQVRVTPHETLHRQGDDLHGQARVLFTVAALGGEITVDGLHGPVKAKVPAGAANGDTVSVKGEGMPRLRGSGSGDLVVHVDIVVPKKLTKEQRRLMEELSASMGDGHEHTAFERIRDWLGV